MKLFLRSHAVLILLFLLQGLFVFFYYWFAGLHSFSHLFYILGVQLLILAGYLAYRWYKDRGVYHWLSSGQEGTDIPYLGSSVFCSKLYEKQMELIRMQHQKLHETEAKLDARVTYMNQWVHQVKTPLSVINLIIQEEDEPVFEQIKKEVRQIEFGLETLLYSSRLDLFERDFKVEAVSLSELLQSVIQSYKRFFIQYRVYPKMNVCDDHQIYTDAKWLKFAIGQLVTNAVKYSAGKSDRLELNVFRDEDRTVLEVKDYGVGIPSQDIKRVFDPYYTGENGRRFQESTGIGLHLVKEITGKLNHTVDISSSPGEGTSVRFSFLTKM
ncbi:two-component system sensor histidine kinase YxdK [Bacillus subtilis]|uniref:two-component system sensor histidine kinase YxdK n=1 Tax=Bacillus subtilis TaxID=1423 RepID=UPI002B4BECAE|nr:two-component system sensor histidine kinase YxdK [Bacillus subtilis]MEC0365262.1 two-component system sensor histidine kinase YxdK [Bacillus subtilis]MEC0400558.1 two-component system sensor histidine kinase YxdK [Bacillus subtilis]MEC0429250.1 two-component system sensor histidine kinase YxdK [Bacillus subtilis]WRK87875.1 two-component system sensor histidine kinase YxdK [Bacillus subtilis]WRS95440.1 two-component system sensor histidine kinase YxdK [Bacillus subtilis]